MIKLVLSAAALAGIGTIAATARGDPALDSQNLEPAMLIGIANPVCTSGPGNTASSKLFYKIAAANNELTPNNELKPFGQIPGAKNEKTASGNEQPLWDNLGTVSYRITTSKPLAQQYFNQGLRLAYGFNHAEAARAFKTAQQIDPDCAMCYWGEALVLGPNINMPMAPEAVAPAVAASDKAVSLMKRSTPREQALIKALATRYSDDPGKDRKELDAAYADAMGKVAARYPADQDIGVFYAEALMNLSPWDYWAAGGAKPKGKTAELVATLERVLKANPDHPGAIHYYIHTVEASTNPKRAEPYAERLGQLMPGAGHIVHMPSHIFFRVGRYKDSLEANKRAVAVDEAYIAEQKPTGIYPMGYYPHNVHFVLVSAQMAGDGSSVIGAADKLSGLVTDEAAREFALAQPVRVAPYFAHAQFSDPDTILALPGPGAGLPYVEGLWHYARGVAFAAKGDADSARKEAKTIAELQKSGDFSKLKEAQVPAQDVLQIATDVVEARIAQSSGNLDEAARLFRKAAEREDQLAYMEPAYWYYPIRQSLGAVLLQKGDLDGAEKAFRSSLVRVPNNGWALYGLAEVYKQRGDEKRAAATEQLLTQTWAGDRDQLSLNRL